VHGHVAGPQQRHHLAGNETPPFPPPPPTLFIISIIIIIHTWLINSDANQTLLQLLLEAPNYY